MFRVWTQGRWIENVPADEALVYKEEGTHTQRMDLPFTTPPAELGEANVESIVTMQGLPLNETSVGIQEMVDKLNQWLKADPLWVATLMLKRLPCNFDIAESEVQAFAISPGHYAAGTLGLLNGLVGAPDHLGQYILLQFDDNEKPTHFFVGTLEAAVE